MIKISIDTSGLRSSLPNIQRKIARCTALALNDTAKKAVDLVKAKQVSVFDRPVTFTQNAMRVKRASYSNLTAAVYALPRQDNYLSPEVSGGSRKVKAYERAMQAAGILPRGFYTVPAKSLRLDAFGNIPRAFLVQILRQVAASGGTYANAKLSDGKKAVRGARRHGVFFVMPEGNRQGLPAGIYRWEGSKSWMVIAFVRAPRYRARLPLQQLGEQAVQQYMQSSFTGYFSS